MVQIRKKKEVEEVSAASMSDVAFLLLVFFMVTAVFFVKQGLNIQLPRKKASPQTILRKHVYEILVYKNLIKMRNPAIGIKNYKDLDDFRKKLYEMEIENMPEKLALIKTTGDTPYGKMLDVLSSVQLKGFPKVSVKKLR